MRPEPEPAPDELPSPELGIGVAANLSHQGPKAGSTFRPGRNDRAASKARTNEYRAKRNHAAAAGPRGPGELAQRLSRSSAACAREKLLASEREARYSSAACSRFPCFSRMVPNR